MGVKQSSPGVDHRNPPHEDEIEEQIADRLVGQNARIGTVLLHLRHRSQRIYDFSTLVNSR